MIRALAMTRAVAGSIFNAYLLVYIVLTPLAGHHTDRFGVRGVVTLCMAVLGVGAFSIGSASLPLWAGIFFGIVGAGAAGVWTPVITVVVQHGSPRNSGGGPWVLSPRGSVCG